MDHCVRKLAVLVVALGLAMPGIWPVEAKEKAQQEYLALGDSIAAGEGASDPASAAYVPLFYEFLQSKDGFGKELALNNLAEVGITAGDLFATQIPTASEELEARNGDSAKKNDVKMVTLSAGGYDLFAHILVCFDGLTPSCVDAINDTRFWTAFYLDLALSELREAAGPDTSIIVMTYSNALVHPACELHFLEPVWDVALEGDSSVGVPEGLNDVIRSTAASYGAEVAEASGLLTPAELQGDCFNLNDAGHAVVAELFTEAFAN